MCACEHDCLTHVKLSCDARVFNISRQTPDQIASPSSPFASVENIRACRNPQIPVSVKSQYYGPLLVKLIPPVISCITSVNCYNVEYSTTTKFRRSDLLSYLEGRFTWPSKTHYLSAGLMFPRVFVCWLKTSYMKRKCNGIHIILGTVKSMNGWRFASIPWSSSSVDLIWGAYNNLLHSVLSLKVEI